jgi:hypothetical protein
MFDLLQVAAKLIIIAGVMLFALFASLRVWRADLDLRQLLSPRRAVKRSVGESLSWLPTREKDALYQHDKVAARIAGAQVDEEQRQILFDEIYESDALDLGSEFEFQKWKLRFQSADTMTMLNAAAPHKGRTITKATCKITGDRRPM